MKRIDFDECSLSSGRPRSTYLSPGAKPNVTKASGIDPYKREYLKTIVPRHFRSSLCSANTFFSTIPLPSAPSIRSHGPFLHPPLSAYDPPRKTREDESSFVSTSLFSLFTDSELEDLETPPRYRPDSVKSLCRATKFTEAEIKRIYRGFKAECPTGVVKEDTFKGIYSQFFPHGANASQYAHYVFNTLDRNRSGVLSFEDFVTGLSILSRGSLEEKLKWTFSLYDINGDGSITRDEMTDIITAIYGLMGKCIEPVDEGTLKQRVDRIFQKMDMNQDGVVTLEEFLDCCTTDVGISASMGVFDFAF